MNLRVRDDDPTAEAGISLVEVLVAMLLSGVLAAAAFSVLTSVTRADQFTEEYSRVLDDGRISVDRIRRELREGRRVFPSSTDQHLHWWADVNQDGLQQAEEQIHYCVAPLSSNTCLTSNQTGTFRLIRWSEAEDVADARTIAATLTTSNVFGNFATPITDTRVVEILLLLDVRSDGDGPEEIEMGASVRLRNVA